MNQYRIKYLYQGRIETFFAVGDNFSEALKKFKSFFPHCGYITCIRNLAGTHNV